MSHDAYLGLGSNLGARLEHLRQAVRWLEKLDVQMTELSSVYESAPVGPVSDQPPFLNAVVRVRAAVSAAALLEIGQRIENEMGRRRGIPKGPRCIDVDLLLVGDVLHSSAELTVPHPGLSERAFVLLPLLEMAPDLSDPRDGQPLSRHLERALAGQQISRFGPPALLEAADPPEAPQ